MPCFLPYDGRVGNGLLRAIYIVATILLVPGSVFMMAAGLIFGLLWGIIIASAASITVFIAADVNEEKTKSAHRRRDPVNMVRIAEDIHTQQARKPPIHRVSGDRCCCASGPLPMR